MSPKEFNRQNKGVLLEVVRRSGVMSSEEAERMKLPELRQSLMELWPDNQESLQSSFEEVTAEVAAGAVFKPKRASKSTGKAKTSRVGQRQKAGKTVETDGSTKNRGQAESKVAAEKRSKSGRGEVASGRARPQVPTEKMVGKKHRTEEGGRAEPDSRAEKTEQDRSIKQRGEKGLRASRPTGETAPEKTSKGRAQKSRDGGSSAPGRGQSGNEQSKFKPVLGERDKAVAENSKDESGRQEINLSSSPEAHRERTPRGGHFREAGGRFRKSGRFNELHETAEGEACQPKGGQEEGRLDREGGGKGQSDWAEPEVFSGVLELMPDGYGFLRTENYIQSNRDIYIPPQFIRRFNLRSGDYITGPCKHKRDNDRYRALSYVYSVNDLPPDQAIRRPRFEQLTPIYPCERFVLETSRNEFSTRIIDLMAPVGKGQRGMIVSPPKAGKTVLLKKVANAITANNHDVHLMVLLIDERPEEVTDMQRSIDGEVVYSTFDKSPENHVSICELVLARAMRLVELGRDVVILMDSITRLARAYNLTINPTGRTLSGGLDPGALYGPKRFFGAARNIEDGGSLTILATSLVETGSRMDEVIFEEFKGTGNMEVYLDRKLSEKRIFPAIDITRSGTRREDLLLSPAEKEAVWSIRRALGNMEAAAVTETVIGLLKKTNNNAHFVSSINVSLNEKNLQSTMNPKKQMGGGSHLQTSTGGNGGEY